MTETAKRRRAGQAWPCLTGVAIGAGIAFCIIAARNNSSRAPGTPDHFSQAQAILFEDVFQPAETAMKAQYGKNSTKKFFINPDFPPEDTFTPLPKGLKDAACFRIVIGANIENDVMTRADGYLYVFYHKNQNNSAHIDVLAVSHTKNPSAKAAAEILITKLKASKRIRLIDTHTLVPEEPAQAPDVKTPRPSPQQTPAFT